MALQTFDQTMLPFWPLKAGQQYSAMLLKFGADNVGSAFKFAARMSSVKSPADLSDAVYAQVREQFDLLTEEFDLLTEEFEELSGLVQRAAPKNDDVKKDDVRLSGGEEIVTGLGD